MFGLVLLDYVDLGHWRIVYHMATVIIIIFIFMCKYKVKAILLVQ